MYLNVYLWRVEKTNCSCPTPPAKHVLLAMEKRWVHFRSAKYQHVPLRPERPSLMAFNYRQLTNCLLSTFCSHILRFLSFHDTGHSMWPQILSPVVKRIRGTVALERDTGSRAQCRALCKAWCCRITVVFGPVRPLLCNDACAPLETICPLLPHPGVSVMISFSCKPFIVIPGILSAIVITVEDWFDFHCEPTKGSIQWME